VLNRLRARDEWAFFSELPKANRSLAYAWWALVVLRGSLPAVLAVATGVLIDAVNEGRPLGPALAAVGALFVTLQVLAPVHAQTGANLGDDLSAHLNDCLLVSTVTPEGMGHLERPDLTDDLTVARDFDLGISGPPMSTSMGFIAGGLVEVSVGIASALVLFAYRWWAPLVAGGVWGATHWLLRESSIWRDRNTEEVKDAQRHADYTYRLAVDAPAAKEVRLFGLDDWTVDRFAANRRRLVELRWQATRLRQQPLRWTILLLVAGNAVLFLALARDAANGRIAVGEAVTFATAAIGTSSLAFGGLNWALSMAAQVVVVVRRLEAEMATAGALPDGTRSADGLPAREVRFRNVSFAYATSPAPVLDGLELTIPAGASLAIVGVNGAGKTTLVKLLCRLYDPTGGAIEVDGVDLRDLELDEWRQRVAAVFQDFVRYELPLRDNVAPRGAPDGVVTSALEQAGAGHLADLDTVLARGYDGGTELSGGEWQRIALARALAAVHVGAGLVILDEPTAQLDVRGEAEIFDRILAATRSVTTVLISHRFSTVRHADRICVLEHGRVVELGSHEELMAANGRYRTMFELQASRFQDGEEDLDGVALG